MRPSSTPTVAGVAPAARTATSISCPTSDAVRRGESVRDDGRLEGDDRSTLVERGANLVRELDELAHAVRRYRHRADLLDAARGGFEREVGAADDPTPGERVSCARRVENPRDGERLALVVAEGASARAVLEDPQRIDERTTDDALLVLVREHDVRLQAAHGVAERLDAAVADGAPRRQVDADPSTRGAGELDRTKGSAAHRLDHQRVAGDVQVIAVREPCRVDLVGAQVSRRAAVGGHRAVAFGRDEGADRARAPLDRPDDVDAVGCEPRADELARVVGAGLPDEACRGAQLRDPRRHVRRLPAGPDPNLRVGIPSVGNRPGEPDDDVEGQVAEGADEHRDRDRKIRPWTAPSDVVDCAPSFWEGSSARRRRSRR